MREIPTAMPGEASIDRHRSDTDLLPGFVWSSQVYFDELDAMGMLHNSRFLILAERANSAFFEANGWRWEADPKRNPDQYYVVREQSVRYLAPLLGPGAVTVEMWVTSLGQTSVSFAFEIRSLSGPQVNATVRRSHIKLDYATLRPAPWTPRLREQLKTIARLAGLSTSTTT